MTTHLSTPAMEIISSLPHLGNSGFLFTTTLDTPVSGFGRARERLMAAMTAQASDGGTIAPFTLHDIRRTVATGMAEIGIAEHVLDRVLNHAGKKVSGTARIYDRHEYLKDRQAALDTWGCHVEGLISPPPDNVIELAAVR